MIKSFKVELFSSQECSLYCQDFFGYKNKQLLFVAISSKFLRPVHSFSEGHNHQHSFFSNPYLPDPPTFSNISKSPIKDQTPSPAKIL